MTPQSNGKIANETTVIREQHDEAVRIALWHHRYRRWAETFIGRSGASADLTLDQLWLLYLVRTQNLSSAQLARDMLVSPTAITAMVDRLVRQGLLCRQQSSEDRRRYDLIVTPEGATVSDATVRLFVDRLTAGFGLDTPERLASVRASLDEMEQSLSRLEAELRASMS